MGTLKKINCNYKRGHSSSKAMYFLLCISFANPSYAYVGPGLGVGTIGVVLGIIGSIILALIAVIWYPLKRLFKRRKESSNKSPRQSDSE